MIHNENSRVKIPAIVHLTRLGYEYLPRKEHKDAHRETNIFKNRFRDGLSRVNGRDISEAEAESLIAEITSALAGNDLGKAFFKMLHSGIGDTKLVDLDDVSRNIFHVVTELTYRNEERDDEFRPDITILINGMPLAFVEVKKPNNKECIIAERDRIDSRYRNEAFRRFANIIFFIIKIYDII